MTVLSTNSQAARLESEESIFSIGGICMISFTIFASFGSVADSPVSFSFSFSFSCHFAIASFTDVPPLACQQYNSYTIAKEKNIKPPYHVFGYYGYGFLRPPDL